MFICEHLDEKGVLVSCPEGFVINVVDGYYGRTFDGVCQSNDFVSTTSCVAEGSLEKIRSLCQGKAECHVFASSKEFGKDPCYGVTKYTFLQYSCTALDYETANATIDYSSTISSKTQANTDSLASVAFSVPTKKTCEHSSPANRKALALAGVGWTCTALLLCINVYIILRYIAVTRKSKPSHSNFDEEKMEENAAYNVVPSGLQAGGTPHYDRSLEYETTIDQTDQSACDVMPSNPAEYEVIDRTEESACNAMPHMAGTEKYDCPLQADYEPVQISQT
jgi:hypothetical protein